MKWALICLGGAAGTLVRYGVGLGARRLWGETPLGTLVVNVLGCFLLGLVSEAVLRGARIHEETRLALSVGLCGGLTTYSSFNQEMLGLFRGGQALWGAGYLVATATLCAGASLAGLVVARTLVPQGS